MRNIIDICNVNITNALHSLYESILSDIEDTMQSSDNFIDTVNAEFEQIKRGAINSSWYNKFTRHGNTDYRVGIKAVNLLRYLGDDKNELITVIINKDKFDNKWEASILLHSSTGSPRDFRAINISILPEHTKFTFPKILKQYIVPIFDSLEIFKDFINENKKF